MFNEDVDSLRWTLQNQDGSRFAVIDVAENMLSIEGDTLRLDWLTGSTEELRKYPFRPAAFDPGYGVVYFEVDSIGSDHYHVIINDREEVKRISKKESGLLFETWKEHLPGTLVLLGGADDSTTFRAGPGASFQQLNPPPEKIDCLYKIAEVEGAWVKINCSECTVSPELHGETVGWTRWHEGGRILIDLRYLC